MTLSEVLSALSPIIERIAVQERELADVKRRLAVVEAKRVIEYCGVWELGRKYVRGSAVTHDGRLWIAQSETDQRPGNGATAWRLAVKRGEADPPSRRLTTTEPRHNGLGHPSRPGSG